MGQPEIPAVPPAQPKIPALPPGHRQRPDVLRLRTAERLGAITALLSRNHLFQRCRREELDFLAATSYPKSFDAGALLCVEGSYASECYVVAAGHAVVTIDHRGVGVVEQADVVGERGVVLETVRAATVIATMPTMTFAIPRERLRALIEDSPPLRRWMLEDVRRHYPLPG